MSVEPAHPTLAATRHAYVRPTAGKVLLCGLVLLGASALTATPSSAFGDPAPTPSHTTNPVALGTAANYTLLSSAGVSTTGTTSILGDVGVSPSAATSLTGFGLIRSDDGTYSTSSLVTGKLYAADYASPTPSLLMAAVNDEVSAYNDAAGRTPDFLNLNGGHLTATTLTPGVYKWTNDVTVEGNVTLRGGASDVFILQVPTLTFGSGSQILLTGGVLASNVFWQSVGQVTLGTTSAVQGVILSKTGIVANSGASLSPGRALAQTAITLIATNLSAK